MLTALRNREILGTRFPAEQLAEQSTEESIRKDRYSHYSLQLMETTCDFQYNHRLLAYDEEGARIVLYDLVAREKMWSSPLSIPPEYQLASLKLFEDGTVLALTKKRWIGNVDEKFCHVFSKGKQTGLFPIDVGELMEHSIEKVHDRIYVLSRKIHDYALFVWDLNGKALQTISTQKTDDGIWHTPLQSGSFYVLLGEKNKTAKIYFKDLSTEKSKVFELQEEKSPLVIGSAVLNGSSLFLGLHVSRQNPPESRIREINVVTGKVVAEYSLQNNRGEVKSLTVCDNYIAFINQDDAWLIGREDNQQYKLFTIPKASRKEKAELSFTQNTLTLCYFSDFQLHRSVFDLSTLNCLNETTYSRQTLQDKITFNQGRVIISSHPGLYIEEFENPLQHDTPPEESWRKTTSQRGASQ